MSREAESTGTENLQACLGTVKPGKLTETTDLECLLTACWDDFTGDCGIEV